MDIGVVLDLMIHDIDLVLSLVRSPLRSVDALGVSLLGGHEDTAHARLTFADGCVANLSASRVSYEPLAKCRFGPLGPMRTSISPRGLRALCGPANALRGEFHADRLSPEQVEHYKTHLAEVHLPREQKSYDAVDALALELEDFVESIRVVRQPRVNGQAGRDALAVAEQILASIAANRGEEIPRLNIRELSRRHRWDCEKLGSLLRQIPILDHQQRDKHRQRRIRQAIQAGQAEIS